MRGRSSCATPPTAAGPALPRASGDQSLRIAALRDCFLCVRGLEFGARRGMDPPAACDVSGRGSAPKEQAHPMSEHVYKKIELVGSSPVSIEAAIENAVARAAQTIHSMRWLEVVETRGHIENGKVAHWQVTIRIGFTLDG